MKKKKCKVCPTRFTPYNSTQQVCGVKCAIVLTNRKNAAKAKQQRKSYRLKREALRPRSWYIKKAQASFNSYIRERDYGQPCISSGRKMDWNKLGGAVDAGHYRSTGSAPHLRFHLWNCHAQSVADNRYLSGSVVDYRIRLIKKIGIKRVEAIESDQRDRKYTVEDLKRIHKIFSKKAKKLKEKRVQGRT